MSVKSISCLTPLLIAKLGYAWANIFFLIFAQNIDCGYSLEPPRGFILKQNADGIFL